MILDGMNRRLIEIFNIDVRKEVLEVLNIDIMKVFDGGKINAG